jgi:hypothetical protein
MIVCWYKIIDIIRESAYHVPDVNQWSLYIFCRAQQTNEGWT